MNDSSLSKGLFREPLFIFFVIALGLFAMNALRGDSSDTPPTEIHVSSAQIQQMQAAWEGQNKRPPTEKELQGLIQSHITEEILVREALALSLDQNDVIVRRRLAQKVRFLLEDNLEVPPPSEDELRAFFEENKEDYTIPATLSFDHIYFSDSAGGELASRIDLVAQSLADDPSQDWRALGDAFMLSRSFVRQPDYMIKRTFGGEFAERLLSLKLGGWEGPIQSGLGQHLVRINTKTEARSPAFEEIAERVTQHYINKARRDANVEQMERLRNQYTVFVEPKDDAGS